MWPKWPRLHRYRTLSSFWQFFPSRDRAWRWRSCLDHRNTGYAGALMSIVTGDMVLLGLFLVCGSSAPVRTEHEGGTAAPSVQGHRLPQLQELWPYQSLFPASGSWWSSVRPPPLPHPFRPLEGSPDLGPSLLLSTARCLKGQPLCCSAAGAGLWEREAKVMAPSLHAAVSPCLQGCLAFLHRHFLPQSPPACPLGPSPHHQPQTSSWIPPQSLHSSPQLLCLLRDPCPWLGYVWLWQGFSVWLLFRLDCHRSAASLSASTISPLSQTVAPVWRSNPCSVPPPARGRSSATNASLFFPTSFILQSFMWFYIFFSTGQELLPTLSWCSAHASVSEGVFLMYPWREMHSMSTYCSTILFSPS